MMDGDLRDLVAGWLGNDLDAARREALLARLDTDPAFRHAFVEEIRLLGMLKVVQSSEPRWLSLEDELGWTSQNGPPLSLLEENVARRIQKLPRPRRFPWPLAAAAVLLVSAGVSVWMWLQLGGGGPPAVVLEDEPPGVAVVVRTDQAVWDATDGPTPEMGSGLKAGRLRLNSGQATLAMLSGVTLFLDGPADLELISPDRVVCHRGKIRNHVPPGAEGFTILAPGIAVVDLGTEIGLNVLDDGRSELMVFDGKAEVSVLNDEGNTLRSALLTAGDSVELEPRAGAINPVVLPERQFAAAMDPVRPPLILDRSYPSAVLGAKPWGYWRFETLEGGVTPNEVRSRPGLKAEGRLRLDGTAGDNHSLVFEPGDPKQALVMDGSWKTSRGSNYAVEVWVLADAYTTSSLISLIDKASLPTVKHAFLLELSAQNRTWNYQPCSVRFLERWPPDGAGGVNVFSRRRYVPCRWHHLVAQKVEDRLELYLDGQLHGIALIDPEGSAIEYRLLVGRLKQGTNLNLEQIRPFVGRLDELAVYDHPLTSFEIRQHFELGSAANQ